MYRWCALQNEDGSFMEFCVFSGEIIFIYPMLEQ